MSVAHPHDETRAKPSLTSCDHMTFLCDSGVKGLTWISVQSLNFIFYLSLRVPFPGVYHAVAEPPASSVPLTCTETKHDHVCQRRQNGWCWLHCIQEVHVSRDIELWPCVFSPGPCVCVHVHVCVSGVGMKTLSGGRRAEEMGDVEGAHSGYRLLGLLSINTDNPDQLDFIAPCIVN